MCFSLLLSNQDVKSGIMMTVFVKLLTFLYLLIFLLRIHMPNICLIKPALFYVWILLTSKAKSNRL